MVVVTIDPETGSVVAVQDNRGNTLRDAKTGELRVGTLSTPTPVTITVELQPVAPTTSPATTSPETGTTSTTSALTAGATCRIVIVNKVPRCL